MKFKEYCAGLDELKNKNEILFRLGIYHLMEVGKRALTEENVNATCEEIMKQDDSRSIMSNEYQCDIVKIAAEIAKYDTSALCVYYGKYFGNSLNANTIVNF